MIHVHREIEKFDQMAKLHISANENDDSVHQKNLQVKELKYFTLSNIYLIKRKKLIVLLKINKEV